MKITSQWFVKLNRATAAPLRIICFPSSGAGANMYRHWENKLDNVEIYGVLLPGRERRLKEKPIGCLKELVSRLVIEIQYLNDKPYIFLGHSMGTLIAYELARTLKLSNKQQPVHLVASAFRTPERINHNKKLHVLTDSDFIKELKLYGGTPQQILDHRETMELLLPSIRADFKLHETYLHQQNAPLECPITSISGDSDHVVPPDYMVGWQKHTNQRHQHHNISGGHFFINENQNCFLPLIQDVINESLIDILVAS